MTIWISRELLMFNFGGLDILLAWIGPQCEKLWSFKFLESFRCSISRSRHVMRSNQTSVSKVMTIWISRELLMFNFGRLNILLAWIGPQCEKLWSFKFLESFRCSNSIVTICDAPKLDIRVKCYDHLNFSRASVVQFWASWYVICQNRTSVWKVMTIWISRELPMFNFEHINIL